MIISASRRTDIPALYTPWLLNRLHAGLVEVQNPYNARQVRQIILNPTLVDCLVLWTKNAAPLLSRLAEVDNLGYSYYVQFTLTPYGQKLEGNVPPTAEVVDTFKRLTEHVGPERVIWRYDPVILTAELTIQYHLMQFEQLCSQLTGYTEVCVFSFFDNYRKVRMLTDAGGTAVEQDQIACGFSRISGKYNLRLQTCAEQGDFSKYGITPAACIDRQLIERLSGRSLSIQPDRYQRPNCGCAASVDIGAYDTCIHGCSYCYATKSYCQSRAYYQQHDPQAHTLNQVKLR